jgi:hypothetical protein
VLRVGTRRVVDPGLWGAPEITYKPAGCRQPDGPQRFDFPSQASASFVALDGSTGTIEGLKAGFVRIRVVHGKLSDIADVTVEERPDCEFLYVTLSKGSLKVGGVGQAYWRALNTKGGRTPDDPDSHMCVSPNNALATFSSSDPAVASIDEGGQIKGVAPGSAVITVAYGALKEGRAEIRVDK